MYHEVGINKLSENQLSKLRNGHPVRVKLGNHHKICLSIQQLKKLHKAHKKGSASTITFDPYQLEAHGSGVLGDIARKAKSFIQKHKLQNIVNPIISRVKGEAHKGVSRVSNFAHSKINELKEIEQGEGVIGDVLGVLGGIAKTAGLGVVRKHSSSPAKRRGRKGKGIVTDLLKTGAKSVAQKGIEMGANYLQDKISGMGRIASHRRIAGRKAVAPKKKTGMGVPKHRRVVGRKPVADKKKTHSGGSLFPAGDYGGALYPSGNYGNGCCGKGAGWFL